jgi:hypothetical protein
MMAEREGECVDCKITFPALRKDGSKKSRCIGCQKQFMIQNISKCIDCNTNFLSVLKDGRIFDKCFECYKKSLNKCEKCNNTIFGKFTLCKACYFTDMAATTEVETKRKDYDDILHKCKTKTCNNTTKYKLCEVCNRNFINTAKTYLISTCQYHGCNYRAKGYFKFCDEHK